MLRAMGGFNAICWWLVTDTKTVSEGLMSCIVSWSFMRLTVTQKSHVINSLRSIWFIRFIWFRCHSAKSFLGAGLHRTSQCCNFPVEKNRSDESGPGNMMQWMHWTGMHPWHFWLLTLTSVAGLSGLSALTPSKVHSDANTCGSDCAKPVGSASWFSDQCHLLPNETPCSNTLILYGWHKTWNILKRAVRTGQ